MREKQVLATIAPVHRTTWWRWVKAGTAPKPISIGPRSSAWRLSDLLLWQQGQWPVTNKKDLPNPASTGAGAPKYLSGDTQPQP
ncbi:AlpA family transcriptional regulator [Comamonas sp.]|uniref:helix-turn-helix transcriptional regulator n=1 Tax=Comamonas sp. TaxID=34028 RepID=UPI00258920A3|nr:AlpA family phage regulatory protein [Comamonas sp.]